MRTPSRVSPAVSRPRGQVMVLTALILVVVFVAVMLTFSIGSRTREKIKMQALADSSAYSLAVAEARTFNFYAWANRAHVAHDVAILSIHAHDSYISLHEGLLYGAAKALTAAAVILAGLQVTACPTTGLCCMGAKDAKVTLDAAKWLRDKNKMYSGGWMHEKWHKNHKYDRMLSADAYAHFLLIGVLGKAQQAMGVSLLNQMRGQKLAMSVAAVVDDKVVPAGVGAWGANIKHYTDAVKFSPDTIDDWEEFVSATRFKPWVSQRKWVNSGAWVAAMAQANLKMIPSCGFLPFASSSGNAKTLGDAPGNTISKLSSLVHKGGDNKKGWAGALGYAAEDHGNVKIAVACIDPCAAIGWGTAKTGVWSAPASSSSPGKHWYWEKSTAESEPNQRTWHGLGSCGGTRGCSIYQGHMRYRWDHESKYPLWNQPRTVAMITKPVGTTKNAYDFDFTMQLPVAVRFKTVNGAGDSAAGNAMASVAGGLVYYHKPSKGGSDAWREPPSLWNPFWRAKLHPLSAADATAALIGHKASEAANLGLLNKGINY